jgi:hypothetical protein
MQWRRLVAITGSYPRNDANEIGHEVARRELAFDVDLVKIPGQPDKPETPRCGSGSAAGKEASDRTLKLLSIRPCLVGGRWRRGRDRIRQRPSGMLVLGFVYGTFPWKCSVAEDDAEVDLEDMNGRGNLLCRASLHVD